MGHFAYIEKSDGGMETDSVFVSKNSQKHVPPTSAVAACVDSSVGREERRVELLQLDIPDEDPVPPERLQGIGQGSLLLGAWKRQEEEDTDHGMND